MIKRVIQNANEAEFPQVVRWNVPEKGKRCRKLNAYGGRVQVQFEDGSTTVLDERALKRAPNSVDTPAKIPTTLNPNGPRAEGE